MINPPAFHVGDRIQTRKSHPCGSDQWIITRTGADIKIRCCGCGHVVMMDLNTFEKRVRKVLSHEQSE